MNEPQISATVQSSAAGFQPAFKPILTTDRHACVFAAIATLASSTMDEVRKKAEEIGLPKVGPYVHVIDGDFIAALLAKYGWVATIWKEVSKPSQLPDLCIAMVDYDADWEVGRHVVFHRAKCSHNAAIVEYCIDPTPPTPQQVVQTDLNVLSPAWYIGVHPMSKTNAGAKK